MDREVVRRHLAAAERPLRNAARDLLLLRRVIVRCAVDYIYTTQHFAAPPARAEAKAARTRQHARIYGRIEPAQCQ
jgi:hypothetical protein